MGTDGESAGHARRVLNRFPPRFLSATIFWPTGPAHQALSYEAVGEGLMRWAPIGQKIVAEWDYEVEND